MLNPEIAEFMKTAKRGLWNNLGQTVRALAQLYLSVGDKSYHTSFDARTDGAFFIIAEGSNTGHELLIVFPDAESDGFAQLGGMYAQAACGLMAQMAGQHGTYAGLDEFCEWFDAKWDQYGGFASAVTITILGQSVSGADLPAYVNASHDPSVWFQWIGSIMQVAGVDAPMVDGYVASRNAYTITLNISVADIAAEFEFLVSI